MGPSGAISAVSVFTALLRQNSLLMPRYKLTVEFDGTAYAGWQRQKNASTIQETLEEAVTAFCGETPRVEGAGRTDAGVHALAMSAHVDIARPAEAFQVMGALNYHLKPHPICVVSVEHVSDDFHARFSCKARHYEYRIINRHAPLTLERNKAWRVSPPLQSDEMHEAAQLLVGQHDFTTFRASLCQAASPLKTLTKIDVSRYGEVIVVRCHAPSFLHHQVRSIVGSLVEVGRGAWGISDFNKALKIADRKACGPVAPPDGLYFIKADYDV